jgi:hypothetical protein
MNDSLKLFCYGSTMTTYADRLRLLMEDAGMDIPTLAAKLGITYQGVRKVLELGGAFGSKNNLKAAELFKVNPAWLASGNGVHMDNTNPPVSAANEPPFHSAFADSLAALFDKLPKDDQVLRSEVYSDASKVIRLALGQLPTVRPTPAHQSNQETQAAAPQPPTVPNT